ncbi:N-acetyltransferase [Roseomonas sp. KE0001]|uniref:GNAT family N-acetyltransferase n=1 Tax=unclassified Roseomonas TaxID=2617492 RepID=UPI0018DFA296|nr:GNAT family N-acetyltransferase [Roseomonas sp. KE0001]MBI0432379.1 N-acetyltransferase [Roseomonas sp. KE0001]
MSGLEIAEPGGPEERAVLAGLLEHRAGALPERADARERAPLCLVWRGADGAVQAGLVAEYALDWLYVDKLWVDAGLRGQGIGRRLLAAAEDWTRARGGVGVHLHSSSFQAPDFYRGLGYAEIGRLEGRPAGHDRFWFAKRLA